MKAVCPAPSGCTLNSDQCMVTPLSNSQCNNWIPDFLDGLAEKICQTSYGPDCPALERLTVFRHGVRQGDAVIPANSASYVHTAEGNPIIAGTGENTYYAYCVECNSCQGKQRYSRECLAQTKFGKF